MIVLKYQLWLCIGQFELKIRTCKMSSSESTVRRILDGRSVGWSILTHLMLAVICLILSSHSICDSRTSPQLKVQLPHGGILVGRHLLTHKGRHMKAFMGIPYAKPPLGKLRFKVCPKKSIKCTNCIGLRTNNVRTLWKVPVLIQR